ncbi:hypothetical protein L873DRAFT_1223971 [Choiromyces venosus 120613-1]|uniref:Uncharacterized protein n=1 Tax=Choiromyces venosus 120613-1 TaxID=1336337 RepID=A0A3N4JHF6_9PEZI|nr:hypothetical protein L873DRAFT_1223971 [Choiromyces venosus 120613-1]
MDGQSGTHSSFVRIFIPPPSFPQMYPYTTTDILTTSPLPSISPPPLPLPPPLPAHHYPTLPCKIFSFSFSLLFLFFHFVNSLVKTCGQAFACMHA